MTSTLHRTREALSGTSKYNEESIKQYIIISDAVYTGCGVERPPQCTYDVLTQRSNYFYRLLCRVQCRQTLAGAVRRVQC